MEITLFILGAAIGWVITHVYSNKATSEQIELFNKLSGEVRQIILADTRSIFSVPELNAALTEKTFDFANPGPLSYKVCPSCGKPELDRIIYWTDELDYDSNEFYHKIKCRSCNWEKQIVANEILSGCDSWALAPHPTFAK
jgi:hypothetical protein